MICTFCNITTDVSNKQNNARAHWAIVMPIEF